MRSGSAERRAPAETAAPYELKEEPTSSHSVILGLAGKGGGRRLLDVGTADGFLARRLSEQGWQVTGIERDADSARQAQPHCSRVLVADLNRALPEMEGRFETILYGDVLEHLSDPEAVFQGLNRFLAPGGTVIVSMPNIAHLSVRAGLLFGRFGYTERGILDRTHLRFFTLKSFREFLRQGGIRTLETRFTPAPLELVVPERWRGPWLRAVQRAHALAARAWPGGLAYQFIAKGIKE